MNDGDDFQPDNSGCFNLAIVLMIYRRGGFSADRRPGRNAAAAMNRYEAAAWIMALLIASFLFFYRG